MSDPAEAVRAIFSLFITAGVLLIVFRAVQGRAVGGLAMFFADLIPIVVIALLVFLILAVVTQ